jgi:hypothetical protein
VNPAIEARLRALNAIIERDRIVAEAPPIPDDPAERLRRYREMVPAPGSVKAPPGVDPVELLDAYRRLLARED